MSIARFGPEWRDERAPPRGGGLGVLALLLVRRRGRAEGMRTQADRGAAFRALHARPGAFVIPNPWDAGTARLLAAARLRGSRDDESGAGEQPRTPGRSGAVRPDRGLGQLPRHRGATDLPVTADLENGYAHEPRAAAEMIRLAAEAGVVGGSIEDATGDPEPIYDFHLGGRARPCRHRGGAVAADPFTLTARAENLLHGRARPRRHDPAAAGVRAGRRRRAVRARAPRTRHDPHHRFVADAARSTSWRPPSIRRSRRPNSAAGVKRISVGGSLSRLALAAFLQGAREMKDGGGFTLDP